MTSSIKFTEKKRPICKVIVLHFKTLVQYISKTERYGGNFTEFGTPNPRTKHLPEVASSKQKFDHDLDIIFMA